MNEVIAPNETLPCEWTTAREAGVIRPDMQRKEVITSAQQCKRISDVLAADLIWCFRLENA